MFIEAANVEKTIRKALLSNIKSSGNFCLCVL